jgi:hypothetical protein
MKTNNTNKEDEQFESEVEHEITDTDLSQKEIVEDIKLLVSNFLQKQLFFV